MRLIEMRRLQSAITSVTTCTDPVVQVRNVMATAGRLCSPYVSRHTVEYEVNDNALPEGVVYANSSRHEVWVSLMPNFSGGFTPQARVAENYRREAVNLTVPTGMIMPVITLAEKLFGKEIVLQNNLPELVPVWVAMPVLVGFYNRYPVFLAAPVDLPDEPDIRQGGLRGFYNVTPREFPSHTYMNGLYGHHWGGDEGLNPSWLAMSVPFGVEWQNEVYAATSVYLDKSTQVVAQDHDPVAIHGGKWLFLHPFSHNGGVD